MPLACDTNPAARVVRDDVPCRNYVVFVVVKSQAVPCRTCQRVVRDAVTRRVIARQIDTVVEYGIAARIDGVPTGNQSPRVDFDSAMIPVIERAILHRDRFAARINIDVAFLEMCANALRVTAFDGQSAYGASFGCRDGRCVRVRTINDDSITRDRFKRDLFVNGQMFRIRSVFDTNRISVFRIC